jgi:hypothetical protein
VVAIPSSGVGGTKIVACRRTSSSLSTYDVGSPPAARSAARVMAVSTETSM